MKNLSHGDAMAAIAVTLYQRGSLTSTEAARVLTDEDLSNLPHRRRGNYLRQARRALCMLARIMPIASERSEFGYREITWTWTGSWRR